MKKIASIAALLLSATLTTSTTFAATRAWSYKIMIDAGHGGTDPGAMNSGGQPSEAALALRCANSLVEKLKSLGNTGSYKLTRTSDTYVALSTRKAASVSYDPYIFNSIHLNAATGTAHGTETWYYHSTGNSKKLATVVQASLINEMGLTNRGVKQNGWTVITGSASVPAVLTEGLFIDNKTEWNLIKTAGSTGYNNWVNGHLYAWYDHFQSNLGGSYAGLHNPRTYFNSSTTTPTTNPTIAVTPGTASMAAVIGASDTETFTVTGTDLSAAISISSNSSYFVCNKTSVTKTGGTFTVTFTPTAVGQVSGTITLTSGSTTKKISVTGNGNAPELKFSEKWNFSQKNGTNTYKGWDATQVRNMTYKDGKLYLVYETKDIKVIKSGQVAKDDTGVLGNLKKGDVVTGGTLALCDTKACDGKIVASNLAIAANGEKLRIYVWDNDQATARLAMETSNFGGAPRIGDCIGWRGTWSSGELVFGNYDGTTTRIITYAVSNGTISATPTVKTVTTDGSSILQTGASTRVYPQSNGSYWIDGQNNATAYINSNGVRQYYIDQDETWGNALATFDWKGGVYAVTTAYSPRLGDSFATQTAEQKAKNYTGGHMKLLRNDDGWSKAVETAQYPTNGLSDVNQNTNCTSNVCLNLNGDVVEAWVLVANQGIAYYINEGATMPTYTYETIGEDVPAPTIKTTWNGNDVTGSSTNYVKMTTELGKPVTTTVNVVAENLTADLDVSLMGNNPEHFSLDKTSFTPVNGKVNGTITVTYNPQSVSGGEDLHKANITFKSTGLTTTKTYLRGTATDGSIIVTYADQLGNLDQIWEYSTSRGNLADATWFDNSANYTRSLAALGDNLYVLNCKSYGTPEINVIDVKTGAKTGTLSTSGISGGAAALSSINTLGNTIVGSNWAQSTHSLKVYGWTNGTGAPAVLLDVAHGLTHAGGHISTYGDMTNGRIAFASLDKKVIWFAVKNGVVNATPNVITLSEAEAGSAAYAEVQFNEDGSFWLTNSQQLPTLYAADGTKISSYNSSNVTSNRGSSATVFNYGKSKYIAYTATAAGAWTGGHMQVADITNGHTDASVIGSYPANGLGATAYGATPGTLDAVRVQLTGDNNSTARFFVTAPLQGIAAYQFEGKTETGVESITVDGANTDAQYYNLQGVRVLNPQPGQVVIKRQGNKATKVLVK